jgi:hypothetical protein
MAFHCTVLAHNACDAVLGAGLSISHRFGTIPNFLARRTRVWMLPSNLTSATIRAACAFGVLPLFLQPWLIARAQSGNTIRLSYVESFDRISPNPVNGVSLAKHMVLTLDGRNSITENWSAAGGKERWSWKENAILGQGWRVIGPNTIGRTDRFPNHTLTMRVTVNGRECSFSVSHNLRSGAPYYVWPMLSQPGRAGHYSRLQALNPTCRID